MDLSTEEVAFDTQNNDEVNFVKRDDWKDGLCLNAILVNLLLTSKPKLWSDTSTFKNSSDYFTKQASLDKDVDG